MTIKELIEKGNDVRSTCAKQNHGITILEGPDYEGWICLCNRYLDEYYPENKLTEEFYRNSLNANGKYPAKFDEMLGILKAFESIPPEPPKNTLGAEQIIESICCNFHKCAKSIVNRHDKRETLAINDEYDVQDLFLGIIKLFFSDVRSEDYVPSSAGSNSRVDFYLPQEKIYIETKMTRTGLADKELGEQLLIDIARYSENCELFICFIYDKYGIIENPDGLITDLEKKSTELMRVRVFISPN